MTAIFAEAQALFKKYALARHMAQPFDTSETAVALEIKDLLEHLETETRRVRELEERVRELEEEMRGNSDQLERAEFTVRFPVELFYSYAARLVYLLQNHEDFQLGLYSCPTVSVLGQVIDLRIRCSPAYKLLTWNWRHHDECGPVLEGQLPSGTVIEDAGFFRNAEDLRRKLEDNFRAAIERVTSPRTQT